MGFFSFADGSLCVVYGMHIQDWVDGKMALCQMFLEVGSTAYPESGGSVRLCEDANHAIIALSLIMSTICVTQISADSAWLCQSQLTSVL